MQVYKDDVGYSRVVAEEMEHVPAKEDPFLREVKVKAYSKSGRTVVIEALENLVAVPLLHLCHTEVPRICKLDTTPHTMREERQETVQTGMYLRCIGRSGNFFVVNSLALSVDVASPHSVV